MRRNGPYRRPVSSGIPWPKFSEVWHKIVLASGFRRLGNVAQSFADMGKPLRFMVIEYAKQEDDVKGTRNQYTRYDISLSPLPAIPLVFGREYLVSAFTKVNRPEMLTGMHPNNIK